METAVQTKEKILTISEFVASLNDYLTSAKVKIIGEVSDVKPYPSGWVYFKMRDEKNEAMINCKIWAVKLQVLGVDLKHGLKIISYGNSEIWPAKGDLTFKCQTIEVAGEGELKKQYDLLRKKLTDEGLFLDEKKRIIPQYIQKIGVITSGKGEVIYDFKYNLRKFGFKVKVIDSRVEGQMAVMDLLKSIKVFKKKDIEVLVIIRGGGAIDSLAPMAPFNNETLIREVRNFPVPVIVGIGHHRDIPLICLAADKSESTPTAVAHLLNTSWENALLALERYERGIFGYLENVLYNTKLIINGTINKVKDERNKIIEQYRDAENELRISLQNFRGAITDCHSNLTNLLSKFLQKFENSLSIYEFNIKTFSNKALFGFKSLLSTAKKHEKFTAPFSILRSALLGIEKTLQNSLVNYTGVLGHSLSSAERELVRMEENIKNGNPEKQLNLGYSIATIGGKLVRSIDSIKAGQDMDVRIRGGTILSEVKNIKKN